jgi:hypothetical protein
MPSTWTDIPVQSSVDSGMFTIVNEIVENLKVITGSSSETPAETILNLDSRLDIVEAKTNLPIGQTVLTGRISSLTGLSNFLEKSTDGNYLKLVSSSGQIVSIAFGAGFSTDGFPLDYIKVFSSQQNCTEWGSTADGTYFCYVDRSTDGSTTCGQSTLAPRYDYYKSTALTANDHVYVIPERIMYYDDGSSWVAKQRVFVGEYVCTAGAVSSASIVTYALRGKAFSSGMSLPVDAGLITWSHNLGMIPQITRARLKCLSSDAGYAVGDITEQFLPDCGEGYQVGVIGFITKNTLSIRTGNARNFQVMHSTSGKIGNPTSSKWNLLFFADRGFQ